MEDGDNIDNSLELLVSEGNRWRINEFTGCKPFVERKKSADDTEVFLIACNSFRSLSDRFTCSTGVPRTKASTAAGGEDFSSPRFCITEALFVVRLRLFGMIGVKLLNLISELIKTIYIGK